MGRISCLLFIGAVLLALTGCALSPSYVSEPKALEAGRLPPPDIALSVPQLGPCTDSSDRKLHLSSGQPVTILVHGCNGSAGRFRSLAQLYAFHGQQAICFSYDDRDSLARSSGQLITALDELASHMPNQGITVMGHSMGGLVARKALEGDRDPEWRQHVASINLITVSAPLAGIRAARHCGYAAFHWLTLGVLPVACWLVTGDNWTEINASSDFIQQPGPLMPSVQRYLRVVTDERDTCRRRGNMGACIESDYIFSQAEQYHPVIDSYAQLISVEVQAGHVEIVGDTDVVPRKLLDILQQQGLLAFTPAERQAEFERLLAQVYGK